ncbi:UBA-like, GBF-interacting protein 1 [Artemisia annua]|uniref:UBA-like, GBF-interacting protein 1 n=1 Tax=Artemisia annua TaxID=35608 RepID=A0A2U1KGR9_ARTAN|nr:UBA-like, GBF-interacting protein 1 [Artemisia annua]
MSIEPLDYTTKKHLYLLFCQGFLANNDNGQLVTITIGFGLSNKVLGLSDAATGVGTSRIHTQGNNYKLLTLGNIYTIGQKLWNNWSLGGLSTVIRDSYTAGIDVASAASGYDSYGGSTAVPRSFQVSQPAGPVGSYDDILNAHFKDTSHLLSLQQQQQQPFLRYTKQSPKVPRGHHYLFPLERHRLDSGYKC